MKNIFNLVRVYQERDISLRYLYLTLVIGFTGSILASFTSLPAPQILGAAFSIIVMSKFVIKNKLYIHQTVRNFAFIIIGGVIGYKLKADFFLELLNWKMSLMFLLVSIVVNIACVSFILKYFFKINVLHSVLLSVPGALSYAIAMSDEYEDKNDASTLIVVQILRVLAVTFIVPFFFVALSTDSSQATISAPSMGDNSFLEYGLILIIMLLAYPLGYFGKLVKIPCSYLLSGLFVIFFFHQFKVISNPIPTPFFFIGMSIVGAFVGSMMSVISFKNIKYICILASIVIGMSILISLIFSFFETLYSGNSFLTTWIAFAPGGLETMSALALSFGTQPVYVLTHQIVRVIALILFLPIVVYWIKRITKKAGKKIPETK